MVKVMRNIRTVTSSLVSSIKENLRARVGDCGCMPTRLMRESGRRAKWMVLASGSNPMKMEKRRRIRGKLLIRLLLVSSTQVNLKTICSVATVFTK